MLGLYSFWPSLISVFPSSWQVSIFRRKRGNPGMESSSVRWGCGWHESPPSHLCHCLSLRLICVFEFPNVVRVLALETNHLHVSLCFSFIISNMGILIAQPPCNRECIQSDHQFKALCTFWEVDSSKSPDRHHDPCHCHYNPQHHHFGLSVISSVIRMKDPATLAWPPC